MRSRLFQIRRTRRAYPPLLEIKSILRENHRDTALRLRRRNTFTANVCPGYACTFHRERFPYASAGNPEQIALAHRYFNGSGSSHTTVQIANGSDHDGYSRGEQLYLTSRSCPENALYFPSRFRHCTAHCLFNQSSKRCQSWQMIFFTDQRHSSRRHRQRQVWPWFSAADFFKINIPRHSGLPPSSRQLKRPQGR